MRRANHPVTELTRAAATPSNGTVNHTFDQGTSNSSTVSGLSVPSMTQILDATRAPPASSAPINPAATASRTNGAWINQFDAPTSRITATSRRLLYAATWIVLITSKSAAAPCTHATIRASFCSEPITWNTLDSKAFWSMIESTPGLPRYFASMAGKSSGFFSLTRYDWGSESG